MKNQLKTEELREFLDEKVEKFNRPGFIDQDPIQIPHQFERKEDIEIAGFLTATIAWGRRDMIIKNASTMMQLMDDSPHDFVVNHTPADLKVFDAFVHRTFQSQDLKFFLKQLRRLYSSGGLEQHFIPKESETNLRNAFSRFHVLFFENEGSNFRTRKHVANPEKGSSAKRLCMYLRWMARPADAGVDFGLWKQIPLSKLSCPLDVHTGNVARTLGMITRKANDWKSVEELDQYLRLLDPVDPVKYDFALFGLGVDEGWK